MNFQRFQFFINMLKDSRHNRSEKNGKNWTTPLSVCTFLPIESIMTYNTEALYLGERKGSRSKSKPTEKQAESYVIVM